MSANRDKSGLRRSLRARRAALTPEEQAHAARRLAAHVCTTRIFRASGRIACYLAVDGEIDPTPIIERMWAMRKHCYLPVLSSGPSQALRFAPARPGGRLARNRFGIPEPLVGARELVRARSLDLILLPLVAFDTEGRRLGMGAGFYDRTLAFLRHREHWRRPRLLGLAHDFQRVELLAEDPWDVVLDGVVTDEGVYLRDTREAGIAAPATAEGGETRWATG